MVRKGTTIYRGIDKEDFEETPKNESWETLTSAFLKLEIAKLYARENGTIYEIKLNENSPHLHAYISQYS